MNKIIKNLLYGFGGELLLLPMSIILPRIILLSFGSEVNGLTSTITQIFTYIALLEAGIGNASRNCLYQNIAGDDRKREHHDILHDRSARHIRTVHRYIIPLSDSARQ